jgi:hypothetical protein
VPSAGDGVARLDGDFQNADSRELDPYPRITLDDLRERVAAVRAAEHDSGATVDVSGPNRPGRTTEREVPKAGRWFRPNQATKHGDLQGMCVAGATGLEPATPGVTGQFGLGDARRRTSQNGLICRCFRLRDWLRSAWLSQSRNRRLGHVWPREVAFSV